MIADRVEETTATEGLGAYALLGATTGNRAFSAAFANGATVRYLAESEDRTVWEIGVGTYNAGAIARDTVLLSSGGAGVAIDWAVGTKRIWSNADAGLLDLVRTALQPEDLTNHEQAPDAHPQYASAEQGSKADTALQPGDAAFVAMLFF